MSGALPNPILPDEPTKAPPVPRGVGFITLAEAHSRSGIPMPTLARKCREQGGWAENGLAKVMEPAGGGKPCWHVREDADGRFSRIKSPAALPFDWGAIDETQRQTIRHRKAMLDAWSELLAAMICQGKSEREATAAFIQRQGGGISRASLYRWRAGWREAGWAGLLDGRREREGEAAGGEFIEELLRLYLSPRQRGVALCYAMSVDRAEEEGWVIPFGERRAQQIIAALDPKVVAYHRLGEREYDGHYGKHIIRDYSQMASNELWVSDGHTLNIFIEHEGKHVRPELVSWVDVKSRYVVGWRIIAGAENADVILSAFRRSVEACGLPLGVYHDNGKAYDAQALQGQTRRQRRAGQRPALDLGAFERLDVKVHHARAYNAKAKLIERWHRTLNERFAKRFDTFCGGGIADKPHDLEQQKARGRAPTLEELNATFAAWLEADYHHREHEGLEGKTPAQVYCESLREKRAFSPELLALELCRRQQVKVGRNGVTISGITYEAPELDARMGQELVVLIDSETVGRVKVLDESGRFLCEAAAVRDVPANATPEELREAMAEQRRDKRRAKAGKAAEMRLVDDHIQRLQRKAEAKIAAALQPTPESIQPVRSKLEADLPAIRQAERNRPAAAAGGPIPVGELYAEPAPNASRQSYSSIADLYGKAVNE